MQQNSWISANHSPATVAEKMISYVNVNNLDVWLGREWIKEREEDQRGGGGGDFSREAIILNISV